MIKIEEVTKDYFACSQCFDDYKHNENPDKLFNISIGTDKQFSSFRLCEECLNQLRNKIDIIFD
jgi:hypothetical protein